MCGIKRMKALENKEQKIYCSPHAQWYVATWKKDRRKCMATSGDYWFSVTRRTAWALLTENYDRLIDVDDQ